MTRESVGLALKATGERARTFVVSRPDWLLDWLGRISLTNLRALVTFYLAVRTGEHYMRTPGWEPSLEWLAFIGGLSGFDVYQWIRKRTTDHDYVRAQRGNPGGERAADSVAHGISSGRDVRPAPGDADAPAPDARGGLEGERPE